MAEQPEIKSIIEDIRTSGATSNNINIFQQLSKDNKLKCLTLLKDIKDEKTGDYLNSLYNGETDGQIRKQIRKVLFALKTTGINVVEPEITGEPVLKIIQEIRDHRAFASNYDIENMRLIVASYEVKKNGFIFFNAALHFSKGLFKLMSGPLDKTGLNAIMKEYPAETKGNMTMVEISPVYAAYLIEEGAARSGKHRDETDNLSRFAASLRDNIRRPADIYNLPVPEATRPLLAEKIFERPLFGDFYIEWKTLEEDKKAYNSIGDSTIILPPYMVEEKKQSFIKNLVESQEIKSMIPLIKRLLEDYAYIFYRTKEYDCYKGLTDYIQDPESSLNTLIFFIKKTLQKSEERQPGLIKNPYG